MGNNFYKRLRNLSIAGLLLAGLISCRDQTNSSKSEEQKQFPSSQIGNNIVIPIPHLETERPNQSTQISKEDEMAYAYGPKDSIEELLNYKEISPSPVEDVTQDIAISCGCAHSAEEKPETEIKQIRKISKQGLELIKYFEGFEPKKYDPILDDNKEEWTIGYGHLIKKGETFETITILQAEALLRKDICLREKKIRKYVKVPLTQRQHDAIVSFVYNVGINAFAESTFLDKLNRRDYKAASYEMLRWHKCNGKVVDGLVRRRLIERAYAGFETSN